MTEQIAMATSAIEFARKYPEAVVVGCWPATILLAFLGVQRVKRLALALGYSMGPVAIEALAVWSCMWIGLLIHVGIFEFPWRISLVNTALISWGYMGGVRVLMRWSKERNNALYHAMRSDRRRSPRTGRAPNGTAQLPPNVQADGDGDRTYPDY